MDLSAMDKTYWPMVGISTACFLALYFVLSPMVSKKLVKSYEKLSSEGVEHWNNNILSTVHSLIVSFSALYLFFYDDVTIADKFWAHSPPVATNCAIVVGYMFADLIIMASVKYPYNEMTFYIFHHVATIIAYLYCMTFSVCAWFANVRLLAELSTPFLNVKIFFDELKIGKTSSFYIVNGVLLTVSFFLFRVAAMPYFYYTIYALSQTEGFIRLGHVQFVLIGASLVLDSCNLFWFRKLVRGALKVVMAKVSDDSRHLQKID